MTTQNSNTVLIIGGGIAGLTAALALNRLGIAVELLEKAATLGGQARRFCCKATDACQQCGACLVNDALRGLGLAGLAEDPVLRVRLETELTEVHREAKEFLYRTRSPEGAGEGRAAALLIAAGFDPFRAEDKPQYGYGRYPNVLTGLDLEEQLRESGRVLKPSDGLPPQSLAFIQCVGSRDLHLGHPYCSQVCCGYALRMANLIRHRQPETAVTFFYMDIQTFGKEFPAFLEETRSRLRFIRAIPGDIQPGENERLLLTFQPEDGSPSRREAFDLVVLSIGLAPARGLEAVVGALELPLTPDGFLAKREAAFSLSAVAGVFLAGAVSGPKSIERSVAQAHQAVEEIALYLREEETR
jgi:heterodisulfide reductase subunit A